MIKRSGYSAKTSGMTTHLYINIEIRFLTRDITAKGKRVTAKLATDGLKIKPQTKRSTEMDKVYKVEKKIVMYVEAEITAGSKAEAKRLLDEGYGEFHEEDCSYHATYKVLHEVASFTYA